MTTDQLTIVHIAPTPFFANRGCHIRIRNEIEALHNVDPGLKIILCTYHHGNSVSGIDTRRIPPIPGYGQTSAGYSPYRFLADILLLWLVLTIVWREKPDLLHCHLHEGVLIGWFVKLILFRRRMPVLMDMQGSLSGELEAYQNFRGFPAVLKLFRYIEAVVYRLPDYIICSSDKSRELIIREFGISPGKTAVSGDMVPQTFFQETRGENTQNIRKAVPKNKNIIIYTGSLLPGKGIDDIVELMPILLNRRQDLFFLFVGYPAGILHNRVEQLGLSSFCLITGETAYDDLSVWLSAAHVALDPKSALSGEASGKVIHYMAAGLPVVCYDLPMNRTLLREFGFYTRPGDIHDFAHRILEVLDQLEDARKRAEKAKALVRFQFSGNRIGTQLKHLYHELISRKLR